MKMIERQSQKMWDQFQLVLTPAMLTSENLMPVYEELCGIYQRLVDIKYHENPTSPDFASHLVSLQNKLHAIENNRIPTMNVIVPPVEGNMPPSIPHGQAIISTLLNRCYKLAHQLTCEESPVEPPSRLLEINDSLLSLLNALESGYTFDSLLLRLLAEELHDIEVSRVNGNYVEKDGSIALNQVIIKRDIEMAHELINEILLYMDPSVTMIPTTMKRDDQKMHQLYNEVKNARDEMKMQMEQGKAGASFDFKPVMQSMQNTLMYLEKGVETSVGAARFLLGNTLQSALRYASALADSIAPVDPSLQKIYNRLQDVYERLVSIRNSQNWEKIVSHGRDVSSHEQELEECDRELQDCKKWKSAGLWMDEQGNQNDEDIYSQDCLDLAYNRANHLLQELLFQKNLKV